jgi:hypothetical protein
MGVKKTKRNYKYKVVGLSIIAPKTHKIPVAGLKIFAPANFKIKVKSLRVAKRKKKVS